MLGLTLPPLPSLKEKTSEPASVNISPVVVPPAPVDIVPGFNPMAGLGSLGQAGMTLLQQQILSQYALMNGLMGQQQQQIQQQQQQQQQQIQQQQSKPVEPPAKKIKTSTSP